MSCSIQTVLAATDNSLWQLGITTLGSLTTTSISAGAGQSLILTDILGQQNCFQITVTPLGVLQTTKLAQFNPSAVQRLALEDSGNGNWYMQITANGILQTLPANDVSNLQIGQLFPSDDTGPVCFQPGGIGTPVTMPVQTPGEHSGQWILPCSHSVNMFMVQSANIGCVAGPSALLTCPICGYIFRVIAPFSAIYGNSNSANAILMP